MRRDGEVAVDEANAKDFFEVVFLEDWSEGGVDEGVAVLRPQLVHNIPDVLDLVEGVMGVR